MREGRAPGGRGRTPGREREREGEMGREREREREGERGRERGGEREREGVFRHLS